MLFFGGFGSAGLVLLRNRHVIGCRSFIVSGSCRSGLRQRRQRRLQGGCDTGRERDQSLPAGSRMGTAWTAAGSLAAGIFSRALIDTFSKGIIGPHHQMSGTFLLAALIGAIIWVLLATWTGLPVSTTHAITGALCGAALAAFGWRGVRWTSLEN